MISYIKFKSNGIRILEVNWNLINKLQQKDISKVNLFHIYSIFYHISGKLMQSIAYLRPKHPISFNLRNPYEVEANLLRLPRPKLLISGPSLSGRELCWPTVSYVSQLTPWHIKKLSAEKGEGVNRRRQSRQQLKKLIKSANSRGGKMIYVRANNSGIKVTNTLIIINHNKAPHTCSVRVQRGV